MQTKLYHLQNPIEHKYFFYIATSIMSKGSFYQVSMLIKVHCSECFFMDKQIHFCALNGGKLHLQCLQSCNTYWLQPKICPSHPSFLGPAQKFILDQEFRQFFFTLSLSQLLLFTEGQNIRQLSVSFLIRISAESGSATGSLNKN